MRHLKLLAMAVGGLALVGGAARPAAAATTDPHFISMVGSVNITDSETFGSNEHCARGLFGTGAAQLPTTKVATVTDTDNGCGGEIRVEARITATLSSNGTFCMSGNQARILLYEGTSESTTDLDGEVHLVGCVQPGQTRTWQGTVNNTDEGGDFATFNIDLRVN
jgi:hypothetical protein